MAMWGGNVEGVREWADGTGDRGRMCQAAGTASSKASRQNAAPEPSSNSEREASPLPLGCRSWDPLLHLLLLFFIVVEFTFA